MSNRTRRPLSSLVAAAATLLAVGARAHANPPDPGSHDPIIDEGRLLTPAQRTALARAVRAQGTASGSTLWILLVPHLAHHDSIAALAQRTFAGDGLDAPGPPRVLLVVAAGERRAAIETGQGAAGIVPEVDSRRIVARLESGLARHRLAASLDEAVAAIAASARATTERRRPLPPDPAEPGPAAIPPDGVTASAAAAKGAGSKPDGNPAPQPGEAGGRSLVPTAALVSAAVVIGLALRRRRRFAEERAARTPPRPPERKGGGTVKSVGDRKMS